MGNSITQDMAWRQSLMKYAEKYGAGMSDILNSSSTMLWPDIWNFLAFCDKM